MSEQEQNINFQGKSNLFKSDKFVQRVESKSYNNSHYGFYSYINAKNNTRNLTNYRIFTARNEKDSLNVIVRNEKEGFLISVPIIGNLNKFLQEIQKGIETLQANAKDKLSAWIIGGSTNIDNGKTMNAMNQIAEILSDRPDIDTSILCGINKNEHAFGIHGTPKEVDIILPGKPEDNLDDLFEYVELNNVDLKDSLPNAEILIEKKHSV